MPNARSEHFAGIFWESFSRQMGATALQNLAAYPEHRNKRFQADYVSRLRTAVRLNIGRAFGCDAKGRQKRAERAAHLAGAYFADYRRNLRQLRSIGGVA